MHHPSKRHFLGMAAMLPTGLLLPGCARSTVPPPGPGMAASVTYLHLLAKVPMFRAMDAGQLQWVIDHSREWAVSPGAEIASSQRGAERFWTLLDGAWAVERDGRQYPAGHADAAKWFGGSEMQALGLGQVRLVATAKSYVMEIGQAELDDMLRRGIPLRPHLDAGLAFYRSLAR